MLLVYLGFMCNSTWNCSHTTGFNWTNDAGSQNLVIYTIRIVRNSLKTKSNALIRRKLFRPKNKVKFAQDTHREKYAHIKPKLHKQAKRLKKYVHTYVCT